MGRLAALGATALLLAAPLAAQPQRVTLPAQSELVVRMGSALSSDTSLAQDRFSAQVLSVAGPDGKPINLPWAITVDGTVAAVVPSTMIGALASLTLRFDDLAVAGETTPVRASLAAYLPEGDSWRVTTVAGGTVIIDRLRFFPELRGVLLEQDTGEAIAALAAGRPATLVAPAPGHPVGIPAGAVIALVLERSVTLPPQH
jgi:hypothetical protein